MKKIFAIFSLFLVYVSGIFAYDISKKYGSEYNPSYTIEATDEVSYYINSYDEKIWYDTVLLVDHDNSIIYKWICESQNDALKKYRELINKYPNPREISTLLIPSLQDRVTSLSTSDSGRWMYCTLDEVLYTDYSDMTNDDFFYLLSDKIMDEELFGRIMFYVMSSFEGPVNFFEYIYSGSTPKEITEEGIIIILDNFIRTEENSDDIDHIIAELRELI